MPIPVTCPSCASKMKAPHAAAGKRGKWPKCGASITLPATAITPSPPPAPPPPPAPSQARAEANRGKPAPSLEAPRRAAYDDEDYEDEPRSDRGQRGGRED